MRRLAPTSCRSDERNGSGVRVTRAPHLQDHVDVVLGYHIPLDPNLLGISTIGAWQAVKAWQRWRKERRGMLTTNFAEVTGLMSLSPDSPMPEIQYEFVVVFAMDHGRKVYFKHGMSCHVLLLHPKSRGSVTLASPNWQDDPLIGLLPVWWTPR